jgi:hypothetical protein
MRLPRADSSGYIYHNRGKDPSSPVTWTYSLIEIPFTTPHSIPSRSRYYGISLNAMMAN